MAGYDVAVIGAGAHGASAALHLAERGARTVVVEKGVPASGPTGRSSAILRGYYVNEFLARATRESLQLFKNFTAWTHGGQAGYFQCGALFLHAAEDGEKLHATCARLNAIGARTEVLSRDQLAREFTMFSLDQIVWGAWQDDAGHADPTGTTNGMMARAIALGAELRAHTRAVGIKHASGGFVIATDGGADVAADRLLVTAGPWTSQLLALLGITIPLWAERHLVATYGWGSSPPVPFVWASIPDGIYFKPERHGQYLVGTLWEEPRVDPDNFDEQLSPVERLRITAPVVGRVPQLEESEAISGYAALYDVAPDWQPVIGEVADGLFIVAGTAGHGFKWSPAMGRHVAGLICDGTADPGLAQFHPDRFDRGERVDAGYGAARILG